MMSDGGIFKWSLERGYGQCVQSEDENEVVCASEKKRWMDNCSRRTTTSREHPMRQG